VAQDNSQRKTALLALFNTLKTVSGMREVGQTVKGPEEVKLFPSAYIVVGNGSREPVDIQNVHFEHDPNYRIYLYQKETRVDELAGALEDIIKLVLDKIDALEQTLRAACTGYDLWVSEIATDEGAIAASGNRIALAIITVHAQFGALDA
jgi:hypothetical protein